MNKIIILILILIIIIILTHSYKRNSLEERLHIIIPEAKYNYKRITGSESEMPEDIRVQIKDLEDSAGMYYPPQFDNKMKEFIGYGLIVIDKDTLKNPKYTDIVLKHELVHALFNQRDHKESHHKLFKKVATSLKILPQYQE